MVALAMSTTTKAKCCVDACVMLKRAGNERADLADLPTTISPKRWLTMRVELFNCKHP